MWYKLNSWSRIPSLPLEPLSRRFLRVKKEKKGNEGEVVTGMKRKEGIVSVSMSECVRVVNEKVKGHFESLTMSHGRHVWTFWVIDVQVVLWYAFLVT